MAEKTVSMTQVIENLKKIRIFEYLSDAEIKKFIQKAKMIRYPLDYQIIRQGEIQPIVFVLLSGSVNVQMEKGGIISRIATLGEGEVLGETGIFSDMPRTAYVVAAEEVVMLQIERKDFLAYIKSNPYAGNKILMVLIQFLIRRLKEVNQELVFDKQICLDQDEIDALIDYYMD